MTRAFCTNVVLLYIPTSTISVFGFSPIPGIEFLKPLGTDCDESDKGIFCLLMR